MPHLTLEIAHALDLEEAMNRLKKRFATVMSEHHDRVSDVQHGWDDNTFSFAFKALGMAIRGSVAVEPALVRVHADLPLAAAFFKGEIENRVRKEVGRALDSP